MDIEKSVKNLIFLFIGIVLIFSLLGGLASVIISAADNVSASGLPFATFLASDGIVMKSVMVGIVVGLITVGLAALKHKQMK